METGKVSHVWWDAKKAQVFGEERQPRQTCSRACLLGTGELSHMQRRTSKGQPRECGPRDQHAPVKPWARVRRPHRGVDGTALPPSGEGPTSGYASPADRARRKKQRLAESFPGDRKKLPTTGSPCPSPKSQRRASQHFPWQRPARRRLSGHPSGLTPLTPSLQQRQGRKAQEEHRVAVLPGATRARR